MPNSLADDIIPRESPPPSDHTPSLEHVGATPVSAAEHIGEEEQSRYVASRSSISQSLGGELLATGVRLLEQEANI